MKNLCCQILFLSFIRSSCHQNLKHLKQNLKPPSNVKNGFCRAFHCLCCLLVVFFIEKETFYPTAFSIWGVQCVRLTIENWIRETEPRNWKARLISSVQKFKGWMKDWWFENSVSSESWGGGGTAIYGVQVERSFCGVPREKHSVFIVFFYYRTCAASYAVKMLRDLLDWLHCNIALPCNLTCDKYNLWMLIRIHLIH